MSQFDLKIRNNVRPTLLSVEVLPIENSSVANKEYVDLTIASSLATNTRTFTGDITGSGASTVATTLSNTGVVPGTYSAVIVDSKGRITSGTVLSLTGDASGYTIGNTLALTLSNTGVTAGVYSKVTIDAKGRVIAAAALSNSDVTTALGFSPVNKAGDVMTGNLSVATPTEDLHAATKAYVDSKAFFALAVGIY